jgi:hypothetical protein
LLLLLLLLPVPVLLQALLRGVAAWAAPARLRHPLRRHLLCLPACRSQQLVHQPLLLRPRHQS